jgi:hypothetical protein
MFIGVVGITGLDYGRNPSPIKRFLSVSFHVGYGTIYIVMN